MRVNFDIRLSKSQQEVYDLVHDDKYKYYTVVFSRQSGKSVLMQVLCIEWLLKNGNSIAYICKKFKPLAITLYKNFIKILPPDIVKSCNGSNLTIETIYGSTLSFFSAEQGSSLRGQTFTHVICDEFSFFKMEQTDGTHLWYDILSPTLKARGKKCIFVSTPLGKNNILYDMYLRGLSDEYPEYVSILKTIYDDGFVTPEYIEQTKKEIPEISFRQEYMCEWLDDGISFFTGYVDCFNIDKPQVTNRCYMGLDISGDGQDETILCKVNDNNEFEYYEITGTLDMKYRKIAELINENRPVVVYGEINGIGLPFVNEVRKLLKNKDCLKEWTTTNSSKEEIISDLAVEIAKGEVHFKKDDAKLKTQLGAFSVSVSKSKKLTFMGKNGVHDDYVMATAIGLRARNDYKLKYNKNLAAIIRI